MFENMILNRILIALVLATAGVALYRLFNRLMLLQTQKKQHAGYINLPAYHPGQPAILYFTTPDCTVCRTAQKPALQQARAVLGERLQLIEVNALEHPDLADRWGVMSVPTTFILDSAGQPQHANYGAASAQKLVKQVSQVLPGNAPQRLQSDDQCC